MTSTSFRNGRSRNLLLYQSAKSLVTTMMPAVSLMKSVKGPGVVRGVIVAVKIVIESHASSSRKEMIAGKLMNRYPVVGRRIKPRVTRGQRVGRGDSVARQRSQRPRVTAKLRNLACARPWHRKLKRLREGLSHDISPRCFPWRAPRVGRRRVELQSLPHRRKRAGLSISSRKRNENHLVMGRSDWEKL